MSQWGPAAPSADDREFHATVIEQYFCSNCNVPTRFPRYNHPLKLYETRTGRCSEWENAFTGLCIAMGHQARKVLDWTDHVWTEVWIHDYQRWVHIDACEPKAFDTPLMYDLGWGKKLTYIIAFSAQEIVDVTNRYAMSKLQNLMRRT